MSPPVCPTCNSPLDPTHAPIARVRGARVVTYCSTVCADNPEAVVPAVRAAPGVAPSRGAVPTLGAVEPDLDLTLRTRHPRRKRRFVLALASAIMIAGMAVAIVAAVSQSTPGPAQAAIETVEPTPVAEVEPPSPSEPRATLEPARLRQVALDVLGEITTSPSRRLQRLAALALSRTGDPEALATLGKLLDSEDSELVRIGIAFALARAGVDDGKRALLEGLEHDRRDVRLDAARSLVELGDDSGKSALKPLLSLRMHRVGAAGLLARLGDDEARRVLEKELRSRSEEDQMRAAVALGRAGDDSVRDRLRRILDDRRFNVGAADALAALGDRASVPALERQLGTTAMRVRAAIALRRLGGEVDLEPLAVALASGDDAGRVSAAEAILILTAPAPSADR